MSNRKTKLFQESARFFFLALVFSLGALAIFYNVRAYPEIFKTRILAERKSELGPREPVTLKFSNPVFAKNYERIKIYPGENLTLRWEESGRKLEIHPRETWRPGTEYRIEIPPGRSWMLTEIPGERMFFSTADYPEVEKFIPENGAREVVLDIEDPITVDFKKSVKDFFVKFDVNPASEMVYENNPEKTRFKILPREKPKSGSRYEINVFAKWKDESDQNYRKIYAASFETIAENPEKWEKDLPLRVAQAKKYTRAKIKSGKYVDINLASQILTIFNDGKLIDSFPVSSGKKGMGTPKGEHKIYNKNPRSWSRQYGLFMPLWMAISPSGKYGIHELPEWPGGYKEGANHLGIPVSHGCVRLGVGAAATVYNFVEIGTPVVVY